MARHARRTTVVLAVFLTSILELLAAPGQQADFTPCDTIVYNVQAHRPDVRMPPPVVGRWLSSRCEIRPGPEFVIRDYTLFKNSTFVALQYMYADSACSAPSYVIISKGEYSFAQASWIVPGGTEVDYILQQVFIMGYTDKSAELLYRNINRTCAGIGKTKWLPGHLYEIFTFMEVPRQRGNNVDLMFLDKDCTTAINFALHELQLMRVEEWTSRDSKVLTRKELFLGDVHTDMGLRKSYRPTGYQVSLRSAEDSDDSDACRTIAKSDVMHPPVLVAAPVLSVQLEGTWVSGMCETQPHGMFVMRRMTFVRDGSTWRARYHFYADADCRRQSYSVAAAGSYAFRAASRAIRGGERYDLLVADVKVTPHDATAVVNMNGEVGDDCATDGSWRLDVEQDVTSTRGCATLGIAVPHVQADLVRLLPDDAGGTRLYVGRQPSDGRFRPTYRPTSFQLPLVQCKETPQTTRWSGKRTSDGVGSTSADHGLVAISALLTCYVLLATHATLRAALT
ncbi:PREDICTED: protein APCDD1-like [Priapulus caudatus]|uniref:Protein APCDD1-like n=1 Tax=Priapulus caudatus TaxID=37621 RepID=A0ABM1EFA6_PRICU|nr:PREDICTED: protein APCDD1-like [Priapulus caudatus]